MVSFVAARSHCTAPVCNDAKDDVPAPDVAIVADDAVAVLNVAV